MYKYKKIISILLLFAIAFSCLHTISFADEETSSSYSIDNFCGSAFSGSGSGFIHYYVDTEENGEKYREGEACFFQLGSLPFDPHISTKDGEILYDNQYKMMFRVSVDGETLYEGSDVSLVDNKYMLYLDTTNENEVGKNPLDNYRDKNVKFETILVDENDNIVSSNTITNTTNSYAFNSQSIGKGNSIFNTIGDILFSPLNLALRVLEIIFTQLLISLGDGVLLLTSSAVGEKLTLETILFGDVNKISLDFWGNGQSQGYMASTLGKVIEDWYNVFSIIAISIFLMMLLIIGIKAVWSSTGTGKAKYKILIKDWIIGVALLFLFPYAMKVMVDFNGALVTSLAPKQNNSTSLNNYSILSAMIGTDKFVENWTGKSDPDPENDSFMYIRSLAGKQKRIPLAIVYLIMVFQLIIIVFVYYKRAFMVAFLITIFPLVTISYTLDKLRWRSNTY